MPKYLVINYDQKINYFFDTVEELKDKAYEALRYCDNDMDAVGQNYEFIDLEKQKNIDMDLDITFYFPK